MTLVELLVAMVILLVGVWTVARGFPILMRNVTSEQERTQAARLAEQRLEVLKQNPAALPVSIRPPAAIASQVDLDSAPRDPDSTNNPPNSRDDFIVVEGERARVPAPDVGSNYSVLVLSQGLVDEAPDAVKVWRVERLQRMTQPPTGNHAPPGYFYMDSSGTVILPAGYDGFIADYAWVDSTDNVVHWVHGDQESVSPTGAQVYVAGTSDFAQVLPETAAVEGLKSLNVIWNGSPIPPPGEVTIAPFGIGLIFNRADAGSTVLITYRLRTRDQNHSKRALYMMEDQVIGEDICSPDPADPSYRYASVQLAWAGLEPHLTTRYLGIQGTFSVVAVDLVSGSGYWEGSGIEPIDVDAATTGLIRLHVPARAVGHRFRFFYTTDDQACIQVYKAPAKFLEVSTIHTANQPVSSQLEYRSYVADRPGTTPRMLWFKPNNIGSTVAVDYVINWHGRPQLVVGELHTLAPSSDGTSALCALFDPNVTEVRAVRGVSVKVRVWWRRPSGKLTHFDLDSILPPLGAV